MIQPRSLLPLMGLLLALGIAQSALAEPLDLQQCIEYATTHSKRLALERAKVKGAEAKVREAKSGLLPQLNVAATYIYAPWLPKTVFGLDIPQANSGEPTDSDQPPAETDQPPDTDGGAGDAGGGGGGSLIPSGPIEVEMGAHHTGAVSATLQQPLFTWGKIRNNLAQAEASLEAARQGYEATQQQLRLDVTEAFYGVLLTQEFVGVAERAFEQVQKHHVIAQSLVDAGAATQFDLLRAEVQLANVKSQLIRVKNGLELARESLKLLLSYPPGEELEVAGNFQASDESRSLVELTEQALAQRPDLAQMRFQEMAGEKLVRLTKAGNKPNLALVSNYQLSRTDRQTAASQGFNITLALSIPVFDGFRTRAQAEQAEMGLEQIQLGRSQMEDGVRLEVKAAYLNLHQAVALLEVQQETVKQATEGLRIANIQYKAGMITSVALTDTELALTQAEINYLQARHDYAVAKARLDKSVGAVWMP